MFYCKMKTKPPQAASRKGTREIWSDMETEILIEMFGEVYFANNRGNFRQKDWVTVYTRFSDRCVAQGLDSKDIKDQKQTQFRADNLKKRYRKEREKRDGTGGTPSVWPWFNMLDTILREDPKHEGIINGMDKGVTVKVGSQCTSSNSEGSQSYTSLLCDDVDDGDNEEDIVIRLDDEVSNTPPVTPPIVPPVDATATTPVATPSVDAAAATPTVPSIKSKLTQSALTKKRKAEGASDFDMAMSLKNFTETYERVAHKQIDSARETTLDMVKLFLEHSKNF